MSQGPLWFWALAVTMLMQTTSAFLMRALPVLGPIITEAGGVAPEQIGHLASIGSLGSVWFLLSGGPLLVRLGPARLLQIGALVGAVGLALTLTGNWIGFLLAAFLIGVGYGPSPPAGSDILQRHAPPQHRGLIFSIKQSGVPLGGAIAALLIPALTTLYDWRAAMAISALLAAATILLVQPWRETIDAGRDVTRRVTIAQMFSPRTILEPIRAQRLVPALPYLTYTGFAFAIVQGSIFAFFVTFMSTDRGFSLTQAGTAFAVVQGVGVVSRVGVGWISDRIGSGIRTLILLGVLSSIMTATTAMISLDWPWPLVLLAGGATGFAAASWNGVYLAEVARVSPREAVGNVTAGSTFFVFIGYVVGPSAFAALVQYTGDYTLAFLLTAAMPLTATAVLAVSQRAR
jgi:MFS family permease